VFDSYWYAGCLVEPARSACQHHLSACDRRLLDNKQKLHDVASSFTKRRWLEALLDRLDKSFLFLMHRSWEITKQ